MARRKARSKNFSERVIADIETFCHDARGLTHIDGRVTFVDGGLPGERVELEYSQIKRDFAEARVVRVLEASPLRREPKCESFGICGACSLQHVDPERQIEVKQTILEEQFRRIAHLENIAFWPPIRGPLWGYRRKARLSVKFVANKQRVFVGFREKSGRLIADTPRCETLIPEVGERLGEIAEVVQSLSIRDRIPQVEVAAGDSGCVLVFRNLVEASADDLQRLQDFGRARGFSVYLQPGGPESLFPVEDSGISNLGYALPAHRVSFYFEALQFTQVNCDINRRMVDRAVELLDPRPNDRVIDLFSGIGNFTLPISRYVDRAVGIEGDKELIAQARKNAEMNGIDNVRFEVADLTTDLTREDWCQDTYTKAVLDPARAGAEAVLQYFPRWGVERIVYISCNPATLARDAAILSRQHGYRLQGAGVMDMFPQTAHVESIALFEKN
ncbi:MAG: 23S rRNA (uracil(1939)-C(5))-methyltransferase RlmD [Gammaproteobacteria bacterium]